MSNFVGTITSQIKVLNLAPLIRFELTNQQGAKVNCLIHQHALNFLALASKNMHIAVFGHYNRRHQFVVTRYMMRSSDITKKESQSA